MILDAGPHEVDVDLSLVSEWLGNLEPAVFQVADRPEVDAWENHQVAGRV